MSQSDNVNQKVINPAGQPVPEAVKPSMPTARERLAVMNTAQQDNVTGVKKVVPEAVKPKEKKMKVFTDADLDTDPPKIEWVIDRLIPKNKTTFLIGSSVSRKSLAGIHIARCIASDTIQKIFNRACITAPTLYLTLEGGEGFFTRARVHKLEYGDAKNFGFITYPFTFGDKELIDELKEIIQENSVVFIDTLSQSLAGSDLKENDNDDLAFILRELRLISEQKKVTFIVIHHCGKSGGKLPRGAEAIIANSDAVFFMEVKKKTDNYSTLETIKNKEGDYPTFKIFTKEVILENGDRTFVVTDNCGDITKGIDLSSVEPPKTDEKEKPKFSKSSTAGIIYSIVEQHRNKTISKEVLTKKFLEKQIALLGGDFDKKKAMAVFRPEISRMLTKAILYKSGLEEYTLDPTLAKSDAELAEEYRISQLPKEQALPTEAEVPTVHDSTAG